MIVFGSSSLKVEGSCHDQSSSLNTHLAPPTPEQPTTQRCKIGGSSKNLNFSYISMSFKNRGRLFVPRTSSLR